VVFNNGFDGIHYRPRFGHDVRNWALFEPFNSRSILNKRR